MSDHLNRRNFVKGAAAASAGAAIAFGFEEKNLLAAMSNPAPDKAPLKKLPLLPTGKIGSLEITRMIVGGNLTSTFAHSRDLIYVSSLLKHYFTDEKIFETWHLCEQNGINTALLRVDDQVIRLVTEYRKRGGSLQWIAQCKMPESDPNADVKRALDNGAVAAYLHGGVSETLIKAGRLSDVEKFVNYISDRKVPSGVAAHAIEVPIACEEAGFDFDFYMKTINSKNYWSAGPMPRNDSVWAETPEITIDFMKSVKKPWIGYKVLGAGAIHPSEGFKYAFQNGCDFICVGMFDFQVQEDARIARDLLASNLKRTRPWQA